MAEDKDKPTENTEVTDQEDRESADDSAGDADDTAAETESHDSAADQAAEETPSEDDSGNEEADAPDEGGGESDPSIEKTAEQAMAELAEIEADPDAADLGAAIGALRDPEMGGEVSDDPDAPVAQPVEFPELAGSAEQSQGRSIDMLMDVKLPISIELGRTSMPISEILALGSGSVVELDKLAGEPVDLLVNNKIIAHGEVVVVDENFGIRITGLVTPEERLNSLK